MVTFDMILLMTSGELSGNNGHKNQLQTSFIVWRKQSQKSKYLRKNVKSIMLEIADKTTCALWLDNAQDEVKKA